MGRGGEVSALDVRDVDTVQFESLVFDTGDQLLAVDGAASSRGLVGAYGTVDGSGGVLGGWFTCPAELVPGGRMDGRADICEMHALRVGLRDFPDGASVEVIVDTKAAEKALLAPVDVVRRAEIYRRFPKGVEEVIEHRGRLTVTARLDTSPMKGDAGSRKRQAAVARHPLMVAAHRLAYALKRLGEAGSRLREADRDWLIELVEQPGNQQRKIARSVSIWLGQR
jgi:hypothetical protein